MQFTFAELFSFLSVTKIVCKRSVDTDRESGICVHLKLSGRYCKHCSINNLLNRLHSLSFVI
jgi:hypothetical protein